MVKFIIIFIVLMFCNSCKVSAMIEHDENDLKRSKQIPLISEITEESIITSIIKGEKAVLTVCTTPLSGTISSKLSDHVSLVFEINDSNDSKEPEINLFSVHFGGDGHSSGIGKRRPTIDNARDTLKNVHGGNKTTISGSHYEHPIYSRKVAFVVEKKKVKEALEKVENDNNLEYSIYGYSLKNKENVYNCCTYVNKILRDVGIDTGFDKVKIATSGELIKCCKSYEEKKDQKKIIFEKKEESCMSFMIEHDENDLELSKKSPIISGISYDKLIQNKDKMGVMTLCFTPKTGGFDPEHVSLVFEMFPLHKLNEISLYMVHLKNEDMCWGAGKEKIMIENHIDTLKMAYRAVSDKKYLPAKHKKYASWILSNDKLIEGITQAEKDKSNDTRNSITRNSVEYISKIMSIVGLKNVNFGWWFKSSKNLKILVDTYITPKPIETNNKYYNYGLKIKENAPMPENFIIEQDNNKLEFPKIYPEFDKSSYETKENPEKIYSKYNIEQNPIIILSEDNKKVVSETLDIQSVIQGNANEFGIDPNPKKKEEENK